MESGDSVSHVAQMPALADRDQLEEPVIAAGGVSSAPSAPLAGTSPSEIQLTLSAADSTRSWNKHDPDRIKFDLPLLYLHHEGEAASAAQRTLDIEIVGLAGGSDVQLEAVSVHADVITGERHKMVKVLHLPDRLCSADNACRVGWSFAPGTLLSDFYNLYLRDRTGNLLWEGAYPERPDFVALDTWEVALGDYAIRVYYGVLFPFARGPKNTADRLAPDAVPDFIEDQFVPIILDTWNTQVEQWGFGAPLHPDWDADKVVEIIVTAAPWALFDGTGTYTVSTVSGGRPYPERRIWWLPDSANLLKYDTLESGYKAIFPHEFFHLMQWNILLATDRPANRWLNVFIEAQAIMAATIQHPEIELSSESLIPQHSLYSRVANRFLTQRLNASYQELETDPANRYDAALYWRFLYEQYQYTQILRVALEEMARLRDATTGDNSDIVSTFAPVMDGVFARVSGPFNTFEESLVAFARANYALRLENGRCADADFLQCDGRYFDPDHLYVRPRLESERRYDGDRLFISGAVPASYGMDFIEVSVGLALQDQPLTVEFGGAGAVARFNLQVWKLGPGGEKPRAVTPGPEMVRQTADGDGVHVYTIPSTDTTVYDRLALIITRLDPDETLDPVGEYTITLGSESSSG